jgi:hypothetical protein
VVSVVPSSFASSSFRLSCSSTDLTIANAIVVPTIAMNSTVTPSITPRFGGNESLSRIPTKETARAASTSTPPITKKKLPSIRRESYPRGGRSTVLTAS